jgi:hypothetical protein
VGEVALEADLRTGGFEKRRTVGENVLEIETISKKKLKIHCVKISNVAPTLRKILPFLLLFFVLSGSADTCGWPTPRARVARWFVYEPEIPFCVILEGLREKNVSIICCWGCFMTMVHFVFIWFIFPFWYNAPTQIWQPCPAPALELPLPVHFSRVATHQKETSFCSCNHLDRFHLPRC